ncbi:hypothetical protein VCRLGP7_880022 [Vibrio crassostreae]|nr:hypothetical protein VCRLGP107_270027 [Vibrio crassostreae]CDT62473.1 hypothetical protein VCRLGP7_880022 [Vibrio crassostreae]
MLVAICLHVETGQSRQAIARQFLHSTVNSKLKRIGPMKLHYFFQSRHKLTV